MTSKEKLIVQVIDGFQRNKGVGSCYIYNTNVITDVVYAVLYNFYLKRPTAKILIVVNDWLTRENIYNYLHSKNMTIENNYCYRILSVGYIKPQYHYVYDLVLTVSVNDDYDVIKHLHDENKFMLSILSKNIMNNDFINAVRNILPLIETIDIDIAERTECINSPVEEHIVCADLETEDLDKYKKANDYIANCITVFGSLDTIAKCKYGDNETNMSAAEFRNNIAKENGWSEDLDMSVAYMRQIDDIYNPNTLNEKACNFYNIAKARRDLVTDNKCKLGKLLEIINDNRDKRILIVNKRGDYAKIVANAINSQFGNICGQYHDCIDSTIAVDENNKPILIKSGVNKGKPRVVGSQAQSTAYENQFNAGKINILSIKEKSDMKLKIACDLVIFTSPLCSSIIDLKARFVNITFMGVPTNVYVLCCKDTIETQKVYKSEFPSNIKVIYDNEENFVSCDENLNEIIL